MRYHLYVALSGDAEPSQGPGPAASVPLPGVAGPPAHFRSGRDIFGLLWRALPWTDPPPLSISKTL